MRMYVPLFALSILFFSASGRSADAPNYRSKGEFDNSCRAYATNSLRDETFANARGVFCANAAKMFCADSGICGGSGSTRRPIQVNLPTVNLNTVTAQVNDVREICGKMAQKADQCCQVGSSAGNPNCPTEKPQSRGSDGSTNQQAGKAKISETMAQNRDLHADTSLAFASSGGACFGRIEVCTSQCAAAKNELVKKVQGAACDGCMDAINGLQKEIDQCESKKAQALTAFEGVRQHTDASDKSEQGRKETADGSGGRGGRDDRTAGGNTGGSSGASPSQSSGMGGMNPMSMMGPLTSAMMGAMGQSSQQQPQQQAYPTAALDGTDCSVNPSLAGCSALASAQQSDSWNKPKGDSFTPAGEEGGDFNVGNLADGMNASANVDPGAEAFRGQPASVASVPNGGGGMPGGGGGAPASLGGGGGGGGGGGAASRAKDVQITERGGGGGYQQMAANMNMQTGGSGGYTYGGRDPNSADYDGLDLSQFLPGGKQDPTRRIAGARVGGANIEIQSKDVNIWNRISDRIRSRCNQGLLRDCIP